MKINNAIIGLNSLLNEYKQESLDREAYKVDCETLDSVIKFLSCIRDKSEIIDKLYQLLDETEIEADFDKVYKDGYEGIEYTIELLEFIV